MGWFPPALGGGGGWLHSVGTVKTEAGGASATKVKKRVSCSRSLSLVTKAAGLFGTAGSTNTIMDLSSICKLTISSSKYLLKVEGLHGTPKHHKSCWCDGLQLSCNERP